MSIKKDNFHKQTEIISGLLQGISSILCSYPFDTIKTRMQNKFYLNSWDCVKEIAQQDGIRGFYRGSTSLLLTVPLRSSFNITLYSYIKSHEKSHHYFSQGFLPGCQAGSILSIFACPIELVKCTMQVTKDYPSSYECAKSILKTHGFSYLFKGYLITLARDALGVGMFFGIYEFIKGKIRDFNYNFTWWGWIACGSVSGAGCWLTILPLDCIKTRYQMAKDGHGYIWIVRDIFRKYGVRGFYAGVVSTVIRSCVGSGVGFSVYELSKINLLVLG